MASNHPRYNRANYLFDAGLRFSRYTSGVRVCRFFLFFSLGCEERWFHFFKTCSPLKIGEEIIHFSCASIFQMGWGTSTNHPASSLVTWMMKNQVLQVHGGKYPQRIASTLLKQLFVSSESGARFTKSSENHQIWRRQLLKTNKPFDCF